MQRIIEAQDLPLEDKVYMRKDTFGWKVVHPIKKDINLPYSFSNTNWVNLLVGGWRNLLMLLFVLAVVLYHLHEDKVNLQNANEGCSVFLDYQQQGKLLVYNDSMQVPKTIQDNPFDSICSVNNGCLSPSQAN